MFILAAGGEDEMLAVMIAFVVLAIIVASAVVFAVVDFRRHLRDDAEATSLCSKCAYDLRAGHERCPECGVPISTPKNASRRADQRLDDGQPPTFRHADAGHDLARQCAAEQFVKILMP